MEGEDIQRHRVRQLTSWFDVIRTLLAQRFIFQSSWFNVIGRVTIFAVEFDSFCVLSTCSSSSTRQAMLASHPNVRSSAIEHSTQLNKKHFFHQLCTNTLCLLQIEQAGDNFFLHEDMTRAKNTYEVEKANREYEGTVCVCDMNETSHELIIIMYVFNSMRLLRDA